MTKEIVTEAVHFLLPNCKHTYVKMDGLHADRWSTRKQQFQNTASISPSSVFSAMFFTAAAQFSPLFVTSCLKMSFEESDVLSKRQTLFTTAPFYDCSINRKNWNLVRNAGLDNRRHIIHRNQRCSLVKKQKTWHSSQGEKHHLLLVAKQTNLKQTKVYHCRQISCAHRFASLLSCECTKAALTFTGTRGGGGVSVHLDIVSTLMDGSTREHFTWARRTVRLVSGSSKCTP